MTSVRLEVWRSLTDTQDFLFQLVAGILKRRAHTSVASDSVTVGFCAFTEKLAAWAMKFAALIFAVAVSLSCCEMWHRITQLKS